MELTQFLVVYVSFCKLIPFESSLLEQSKIVTLMGYTLLCCKDQASIFRVVAATSTCKVFWLCLLHQNHNGFSLLLEILLHVICPIMCSIFSRSNKQCSLTLDIKHRKQPKEPITPALKVTSHVT